METLTKTMTETNETVANVESKSITLDAPVFIMFAEYLGYVSRFNKIAEDMCNGTIPDIYIQKVLKLEALTIFKQMKKDYSISDIRYWYNTFYPIIIKDYVEKLNKLIVI